MNIVVLVKQVPAVSEIEIAQDNNLVRVGAPSMLNPVDKHAIEAAIAVKDAVGGTVTLSPWARLRPRKSCVTASQSVLIKAFSYPMNVWPGPIP